MKEALGYEQLESTMNADRELIITSPIPKELSQQLNSEEINSDYVGEMDVKQIVDLVRHTDKIVITEDPAKAQEIIKLDSKARIICFDLKKVDKNMIKSHILGKISHGKDIFTEGSIIWIPTPESPTL